MEWYWHFLGLKPGATKAEIKSAYHRLAKLLHRDHGGTDEDMQRLNEAYHLALADDGSAYHEPPKAEPRHEPPPQPPRQEPPSEPVFKPIVRGAGFMLKGWGVVVVIIAVLGFLSAMFSDPQTPPNSPSQPAPHVAAQPAPEPPKDDGTTYENTVKLLLAKPPMAKLLTKPSEAPLSYPAVSECTYSTPPYSGRCGRRSVVENHPKPNCVPKTEDLGIWSSVIECR